MWELDNRTWPKVDFSSSSVPLHVNLYTLLYISALSHNCFLGQSISDRIWSHANATMCFIYIYIYVRLCILSLYIYLLTFTNLFIHLFIYLSYSCVYLFICVNYTISLAWIVRPFGDDFPYWPWCVYSPLHPGAEIHPAAAPLLSVAWPAGFARPAPPPRLGPASIQGKSAMLMFSLDHSFKYARSIKYNII